MKFGFEKIKKGARRIAGRTLSMAVGVAMAAGAVSESTEAFSQTKDKISGNIIITHDPNDPQLKEYEDSLRSYENFNTVRKIINNMAYNKFYSKNYKEEYIADLFKKYPSNKKLSIKRKNPTINREFNLAGGGNYVSYIDYKKPTQKVVYKPEEKKEEIKAPEVKKQQKTIKTELDKSGLFMMHDGKKYTYEQLIGSFPEMKIDAVFKQAFPGRERPKE